MDDIPEAYDLETIDQLRAIADSLRVRIVEALALRPMTATQVGEELGEPAPKAHYHVRELERVGLVRMVETRERGGILEKYYRAVARAMRVPATLLRSAPPDVLAETLNAFLNSVTTGFQTAMSGLMASGLTNFDETALNLSGSALWMTPKEYQATLKQALDLFKPYSERRGVENEREISLTVISYDARLARTANSESTLAPEPLAPLAPPRSSTPSPAPLSPEPPEPLAPTPAESPRAPKRADVTVGFSNGEKGNMTRKVVVAGAVNFSRRELEEMAAKGEQYDLNVFGYLSFAHDVSADLARRTIARLSYHGVLNAPDSVREVLKEKER